MMNFADCSQLLVRQSEGVGGAELVDAPPVAQGAGKTPSRCCNSALLVVYCSTVEASGWTIAAAANAAKVAS